VDLVEVGGWLPMSLGAVIRAGLAAGPLRLGLGRPFGEGRGLALAVALRLLQLAGQALNLGFELGDPVPQVSDQSVACAAAGADRGFHTCIIGRGQAWTGGPAARPSAGVSKAQIRYWRISFSHFVRSSLAGLAAG
jgi:hypothetical protein